MEEEEARKEERTKEKEKERRRARAKERTPRKAPQPTSPWPLTEQPPQQQAASEPALSNETWHAWDDYYDYEEDRAWWTESREPTYSSRLTDPLGFVFFIRLESMPSLLSEHVHMRNSPTYVILDSACTKAIASRYAVNRLMKACQNSPEYRSVSLSFEPCRRTASFANSDASIVGERLHTHIKSELSPTGSINTTVDVLDYKVVFRSYSQFSIEQMRNLQFTLEHTPISEFLSCPGFGMKRTPLPVSTSNHAVLDVQDLVRTTRQPKHSLYSS